MSFHLPTLVSRSERPIVGAALAVAGAGAALYAGLQGKKVRDSAAVVELYNLLVELGDATTLTPDHVKQVGDR